MNDRTAQALRLPGVRDVVAVAWRKGALPVPRTGGVVKLPPGGELECDLGDHTQRKMWLGIHETEETDVVRRLVGPGATIVDVGAHIGWYTVLAARLVGPTGRVVAIEPYPPSFEALRRNVSRNGLTNVSLHCIAASDRPCEASIGRQAGSDSGSATIGHRGVEGASAVEMRSLDELLPGVEEVALMKIDVEGHEAQVLGGATDVLRRTRHVLIELNERALAANGSSGSAVRALLDRVGFRSQRTVGGPRFAPLRREHSAAASYTNLVASR